MDKALTAYKSEPFVTVVSTPQALKQWVHYNSIPTAEIEANQNALGQVQEEDKMRHAAEVKNAMVKYEKQYSRLTRFMRFVVRGFKQYQPDIAPVAASPETQLLEQVVALQDAVVKGYELFKALPDVVQKMKQDYEKLAARQNELEFRIAEAEEDFRVLPERQKEYASLIQRVRSYDTLPEEEKKDLSAELQAKTGVDVFPSIENTAVRSIILQGAMAEQQRLATGNISSLLEILNFEYVSVQRQQRIIESQEQQLEQGWKPARIQLSRVKEQYDMLNRFTSGARLLIGMNELRRNTAEMIAQSEEVMSNAAVYINNTRIEAEAYEESFAQLPPNRISPEADTDEAIIIDVEEEPFVVERK